jgi:hypothetical protein
LAAGANPFPGLEPFTAALSRVFFGPATEACGIGNRVRLTGPDAGMLAIVGPSGLWEIITAQRQHPSPITGCP